MNFPPFFYSRLFWEAASNVLSGVAGLLYVFGFIDAQFAISAAVLLQGILAVLKFFGIEPALRAFSWSAKAKKLLGR